jgi:hypothetical protein
MKKKGLLVLFLMLLIGLSFSVERECDYPENKEMLKKGFSFNLNFEQVKAIIQKHYPNVKTDAEVLQFIEDKKIQKYETEGEMLYFDDMETNLFYRDLELIQRSEDWGQRYRSVTNTSLYPYYHEGMNGTDFKSVNSPYFNQREYLVDYSIQVDKEKLPAEGHIRLWVPLPLQTACQRGFKLIKAEPSAAVIGYPKTSGDVAYIHFDLDMKNEEDLNVSISYTFTHYQQGFEVDLEEVGTYDLDSDLYKQYTKSTKNIFYNEAMKNLAQKIVGNETNPYLMAKKLYYYIVNNISYSLMAHVYLEAEGIPESLNVFENGYGDCGSQAMFFSALCRSLGIPARTTGGFQLFSHNLGSHFWAEFYLPNYGWVPVDTSVGRVGKYAYWLSEKESEDFTAFFFGNQDPLRMVVQKDVNVTPDIIPKDVQILSLVLQNPYIDVDYGNENFEITTEILEHIDTKTYYIQ